MQTAPAALGRVIADWLEEQRLDGRLELAASAGLAGGGTAEAA
jgi:hypothetical protein